MSRRPPHRYIVLLTREQIAALPVRRFEKHVELRITEKGREYIAREINRGKDGEP